MMSTPLPELPFVLFALLLHFVWEMLQAPLWVGMANLAHAEGVRVCAIAALGDVVIALVAYWSATLYARSRLWLLDPPRATWAVYIVVGLVLTVAYEYAATGAFARWEYAASQPRLPVLGTGLAPVLQWLLLPPLTVWLTRIHVLGRMSGRATRAGQRSRSN